MVYLFPSTIHRWAVCKWFYLLFIPLQFTNIQHRGCNLCTCLFWFLSIITYFLFRPSFLFGEINSVILFDGRKDSDDAGEALKSNKLFEGKRLRVERAKVNRTLFIAKLSRNTSNGVCDLVIWKWLWLIVFRHCANKHKSLDLWKVLPSSKTTKPTKVRDAGSSNIVIGRMPWMLSWYVQACLD